MTDAGSVRGDADGSGADGGPDDPQGDPGSGGWAPPDRPQPPRPGPSTAGEPDSDRSHRAGTSPTRAPGAPRPEAGGTRTGPLPLHPMSLGDILDGAFKLLRADAGTILLITIVLFGPLQLIAGWAQRGTLETFQMLMDPETAMTAFERGFGDPLLGGVAGLAQFLVLPFVAGAVARVVGGAYLGETVSAGTALRAALRRWWSLFAAWVLVHLAEFSGVVAGFLLLLAGAAGAGGGAIVAGVIVMFLGLLGALFVMPLFVAVAPAIVMEDVGAVQAMGRSVRLMRRRYWPYLGTAALTGVLATVVTYAIAAVPTAIAFAVGPGAWLVWALGSVLANLVALPFVAIVATLMYFDGRIRGEAFDLTVVADELAAGRPA